VQLPSQLGGGSKDVASPSPALQTNELVVSVAGSSHDPLGVSHEQAPQVIVDTSLGSAWPV
jgi:hypothetical protein